MRVAATLLLGGLALAACSKGQGASADATPPRLGPNAGTWSARPALEGPMAVWGPPGLGKEVLSVTCLPQPRRTLVISLFAPATPSKPPTGELMIRVDGKAVGVPLVSKAGGGEARLPVSDALVRRWEGARDLRFDVAASPGDGADTGPVSQPLKEVVAACR